MSQPPKAPPRFIPTLTEVVGESSRKAAAAAAAALPVISNDRADASKEGVARWNTTEPVLPPALAVQPAQPSPQHQSQGVAPVAPPAARPLPSGFEEYVVHRVMQRVDVGLEQQLRDAIATVVQEQTRSLLPRLREEVESVVRHVVYEAVSDELATGEMTGTPPT